MDPTPRIDAQLAKETAAMAKYRQDAAARKNKAPTPEARETRPQGNIETQPEANTAVAVVKNSIRDYLEHGFVLVPIPRGLKGPEGPGFKGWNKRENCIGNPKQVGRIKENFGLAHAYSRTCSIDIDDVEASTRWLNERGVSLGALMDEPEAVRISSGRPNRAKLIYRLPDGVEPLPSKKIIEVKNNIIDFRCATSRGTTVQDVLPPSIHPDTKQPYRWEYADDMIGDWRALPALPVSLLTIWQGLLNKPTADRAVGPSTDLPELRELLKGRDPDCDRETWVEDLAIIHHETQGGAEGFALADEWSSGSDKYAGSDEVETVWNSFNLDHPNPKTAASWRGDTPAADPMAFDVEEPMAESEALLARRFPFLHINDIAARPEPDWIIEDVLPQADIGMVYGESGSGKSFWTFDLVSSVARGLRWREKPVAQCIVGWIAAEAAGSARNRAKAYAQHHEVELAAIPLWLLPETPDLSKKDHVTAIAKEAKAAGIRLLVVDTLAAASAGANENAGEDMGRVLAGCRRLRAETGAMILLIHHSGKDASKGARGWSGIRAAVDVEIEITRQEDARSARVSKLRDGADGAEFGFRLLDVIVDPFGEKPATSCVVEHAESAPKVKTKKIRGMVERIVYDCALDRMIDAGGVQVGVLRAAARDQMVPGERDRRRELVARALNKLLAEKYLVRNGDKVVMP